MKNYNVASAVTVSEERGVISGKYQWLPEMPTGKTELKVSCLILDTVKRRAATGVAVSTEKVVNLSQRPLNGDQRCRQRNLHKMSYTIKYRVKTRRATGVAVSTERVKHLLII